MNPMLMPSSCHLPTVQLGPLALLPRRGTAEDPTTVVVLELRTLSAIPMTTIFMAPVGSVPTLPRLAPLLFSLGS